MNYYLVIEKYFEYTYWCKQYIIGLKEEANKNKIKICEDCDINFEEEGIVFLISTGNCNLIQINKKNKKHKVRIILIGPQDTINCDFSNIMCDFKYIARNAIKYCTDNNKKKILLYGINPNSQGDIIFEKTFKEELPDVYQVSKNYFDLTNQSALLVILQNYDAIICNNMIVAKSLVQHMKKISDTFPWVISLLDSPLREYSATDITCFQQNEIEIGRQALHLALELKKITSTINITWKTKATFHLGETTNYINYKLTSNFEDKYYEEKETWFYNDDVVTNSLKAENLVSNLTNSDLDILKYLGQNYTYKQMADTLNIGESTIKYRMKRLQTKTKTESRKELVCLLENYTPKLLK